MELQLLENDPSVYQQLPDGQRDAYQLLLELEPGAYSQQFLMERLQLRSRLPLFSRINHLAERGMIRIISNPA